MKTEIERISEIMETLLAHQPIIDVPYDKINDIAIALVKEGYGNVSEYKAEVRELKADLDHQINATNDAENLASHLQYDYDKCFKRLKSMQKELNELKDKLKSVAYVEPIKDVVIIKRSDFDNIVEENKQ